MLPRLLVLTLLGCSVTFAALTCNALQGRTYTCFRHVLVAIDASSSMQNNFYVEAILNFIGATWLPLYSSSVGAQYSFALYGLQDPSGLRCRSYDTYGYGAINASGVCSSLNAVNTMTARGLLAAGSLNEFMYDITNCTALGEQSAYDHVVLFTASNDQADIQNASWFPRQAPVSIVNIGNGDFSSWTSVNGTIALCNATSLDRQLANNLVNAICEVAPDSDHSCSNPQPTFQPPDDQIDQCDCDFSTTWNDIMVVADSSGAMGSTRFTEMMTYIQSVFLSAPIGQQAEYQTRMGVVLYEKQATLIANLSKYQSPDDMIADEWPFLDGDDTNILAGVNMAMNELVSSRHREKSRKVIILGASTYRESIAYSFPVNQTLTFKRNNGIIIVLAYGDIDGVTLKILQDVASPGYYIDASQHAPKFSALQNATCRANCFCPGYLVGGYNPVDDPKEDWPSGGCFWDSSLTAVEVLANRECGRLTFGKGVLAQPKNKRQQYSVLAGAPQNISEAKPNFWIDLKRKSNQWQWGDGAPLVDTIVDNGGDCATLSQKNGFNVGFTSLKCSGEAYYTCMTAPCTSKRYCN